jgi:hypothetical protein
MRGVQELVGHQSLAMTQRDSHLTPASLDSTIRLLEHRPARRVAGDNLETPEGRSSQVVWVERVGWLGVRDGIRNWLVTAA